MMKRPLRTSRGENTSAVWGVTNFLLRLIDEHDPRYLAWVHDAGTSFRHETFPEYKATREKLDAELQDDFDSSLRRITRLLEGLGVPLVEVPGYEADDVIGTLARESTDRGMEAVIVSGDKDFHQLVRSGVSLLNPGRGGPAAVDEHWVDTSNAEERLGVPPERVVDYLALVGDSSDNVPGVKGIGDKTARALIEEFGDLETILARAESVKGKRAREALLEESDNARLSRELVTISTEVPLEIGFEDLERGETDTELLIDLFTDLEFHSLLDRFKVPVPQAEIEVRVVGSAEEIEELVAHLRQAGRVALICWTSGEAQPDLVGIALGIPGAEPRAWYVPLAHRPPDGALISEEMPPNLPPLTDPALAPLGAVLEDGEVSKWGHDLKGDWLALERHGLGLRGLQFDVMLASFLLDPGRRSHDLVTVSLDLTGQQIPARAELVGKGRDGRPAEEVPADQVAKNLGTWVGAVITLGESLRPKLQETGMDRLLAEIEMPLVEVLGRMQGRGIMADLEALDELSRQFGEELASLERDIYAEAGTDFNLNSTHQLRHILFEKLQLPVIKKTKTGPSTDADVLAQLAGMEFRLPELMLEYRELTKLKSTYVDVLPATVRRDTGRIHTKLNQTGAATGRLSSSDPNLQNIPIRSQRGELIRKCFVAAPGCQLISADYSQIELRVLAHLSEDPVFLEAFRKGEDVHRETAAVVFEVDPEEVTGRMRGQAKTINFATIYGQGAFALSKQLGIELDQARDFIRRYFERLAGVRDYLDRTVEEAKSRGYVETIFGRRRYIPELRDKNRNVRAFGERTAMNSPIQGSAADIIKVAMIGVERALAEEGVEAAMILQVHDELVLESQEKSSKEAQAIVRREMEQAAELRVPLVVDVGSGDNWLNAKG